MLLVQTLLCVEKIPSSMEQESGKQNVSKEKKQVLNGAYYKTWLLAASFCSW
jgi:hypothetical protein